MSINTVNMTSTLYMAYGLKQDNSVSALLGGGENVNINNNLFASLSGKPTPIAESSLTKFVKDNIPNNLSLLQDIKAVEALQNLFSKEIPQTAAFINVYQQAVINSENNI